MLDNPLRLLMFPSSNPALSEEEISWKIQGLEESLQSSQCIFRKICKSDGTAVGLAGWTIDKGFHRDSKKFLDDHKDSPSKDEPKKDKRQFGAAPKRS